MRRKSFVVTLDLPLDATIEDCIEYIHDAVSTWKGQLRPPCAYDDNDSGDPMWGLDNETVKVTVARSIA